MVYFHTSSGVKPCHHPVCTRVVFSPSPPERWLRRASLHFMATVRLRPSTVAPGDTKAPYFKLGDTLGVYFWRKTTKPQFCSLVPLGARKTMNLIFACGMLSYSWARSFGTTYIFLPAELRADTFLYHVSIKFTIFNILRLRFQIAKPKNPPAPLFLLLLHSLLSGLCGVMNIIFHFVKMAFCLFVCFTIFVTHLCDHRKSRNEKILKGDFVQQYNVKTRCRLSTKHHPSILQITESRPGISLHVDIVDWNESSTHTMCTRK